MYLPPSPPPRGQTDAFENITSFAGGGVGTSHASSTYPTPPLGYHTPTPRIPYPLAIPCNPIGVLTSTGDHQSGRYASYWNTCLSDTVTTRDG